MKKFFTFFLIITLLCLIALPNLYATNIIMDLENNTINTTNNNNILENNDNENTNIVETNNINNLSSNFQNSSPTITTVSSDNNEFLTIENILSISLIVIGILLVFLSIAILIRCKSL